MVCRRDLPFCFEGEGGGRCLGNAAAYPSTKPRGALSQIVPTECVTVRMMAVTGGSEVLSKIKEMTITSCSNVQAATLEGIWVGGWVGAGGTLSVPTSHVFVCRRATTAFMRRACGLTQEHLILAPVF